MTSFVYFIQPVNGGPIKIGTSGNPQSRLQQQMLWSPFPLRLLGAFPGNPLTEFRIHDRFAAHRTHGEWFRPAPEIVSFIEAAIAAGEVEGGAADLARRAVRVRAYGLGALLKRHNIPHQELTAALGLRRNNVSMWISDGMTLRRIPDVIEFFAARGISITENDLYGEAA